MFMAPPFMVFEGVSLRRQEQTCLQWSASIVHWYLEAEVRRPKSPNGRLCAKDRSWLGLQFDICGTNFPWRKHQLNACNFLKWKLSKIFVSLGILYFSPTYFRIYGPKNARKKYNIAKVKHILDNFHYKKLNAFN